MTSSNMGISSLNCSLYRKLHNSKTSSLVFSLAALLLVSQSTMAAPIVLVDISPSHSLVSMVMGDVGEPKLLISSASNPHDFAMRPSDASKLSSADVIFYTSSTLTPWLSKALNSLAQNTPTVELIHTDGTARLPIRHEHIFSNAEHEKHEELTGQIYDPHAWLNPENAMVWLNHIADELANIDSVNAATYQENADRAIQKLKTLTQDVEQELNNLQNVPYLVFHDSYQYFETRFNLKPAASINLSDGTQPGISQIQKLQKILKSSKAQCVFSEPQYSDRLVNTVVSGIGVRTKRLDPLGFNLKSGNTLYVSLIKNLSHSLSECLSVK